MPTPIEPGLINVVGRADGDGHLMPWLLEAKQPKVILLDGGDVGSR
mgnify:CR=1 FL=1